MRQREPAICLHASDYSETSQVVHFFTRGAGVVRLLGKGTKRPKSKSGGAIDLLSEGELVFSTSRREGLGTLMEFSETTSRSALRKDRGRLNAALYMVELVGQMLAQGDPHPEVFDLLHSGLDRLACPDAPVSAVLAYFQWRLMRLVGLMGELTSCVMCGGGALGASGSARTEAYFSSTQGGLLCGGCESTVTEKLRLDGAALAGLAALAAAAGGAKVQMPEKHARCVNRMLAYHVRQQLGKALKMARHAIG